MLIFISKSAESARAKELKILSFDEKFCTLKEEIRSLKEISADFQADTKQKSGLRRSLYICTTNLQHFSTKSKFNISSPLFKKGSFYDIYQESDDKKTNKLAFSKRLEILNMKSFVVTIFRTINPI